MLIFNGSRKHEQEEVEKKALIKKERERKRKKERNVKSTIRKRTAEIRLPGKLKNGRRKVKNQGGRRKKRKQEEVIEE
jgi:hypothetical protein